ncbi:MAG: COG4223 family protein [Bauldia sp.]
MAEGDENRPRQTGRRPSQKAPVTIDLPSERVEPVPAAPPPPPPTPPNARRAAGAAPPGDTPGGDRARPAVPTPRPRRGMLLLGVFLGALLGGAIVFGAGWYMLRDRLDGTTADGTAAAALAEAQRATADLATLRNAIAAAPPPDLGPLTTRLTALETATADLPAIRTGLADATRTAADAETAAGAQTAAIDRLAGDLAALEQRTLTAAVAGGDPEAIATLNQDLAAFEQRIGALERAGPPPQLATLQRRVDDLAQQIAGFATTATALQGDTAERERTEAAARALALSGLQAAVARGEPFAAQLAVLGQLGVAPAALAALRAYATDPPPTAAQLATDFSAVADAVLAATNVTDPDANFLERLIGNARTVITVRPTEPIEGTTPEAILSRMQAAADAGNFPAALAERDALPDAGQAASADWAAEASARIALDAALGTLVTAMGTTATP